MTSENEALDLLTEEANFATPKWGPSETGKTRFRQLSSAHGTERLFPDFENRSSSEDDLNFAKEGKAFNEKTFSVLTDLSDQDLFYSSNRKASQERYVSVSLLTDCGKSADPEVVPDLETAYHHFAGDLQDVKLDLTLLDMENKEMQARLRVQKRKIASIEFNSMRETAQLHREISYIREFLSLPKVDFLPLQPKSGPGAECCNLF